MKKAALVMLALMLLFSGCSKTPEEPEPEPPPEVTPAPTPTPTPTPTPEPTPEPVDYGAMNPLNGLPLAETHIRRRPVAVMYNNIKAALPLMGISKADLIYEALAEGGITRIVGMFKDTSEVQVIGTVRSTRAYYLDIAQGHDALLMHVGYSEEARLLIRDRGLYTLNGLLGGFPFFYRDDDRRRSAGLEHSMMASGADVETFLTEHKTARVLYDEDYDPYSLLFADSETPERGEPAKTVGVTFSNYKTGLFEYFEEDGLYYVSQYGNPMTDGSDSSQVTVKNVLVLRAEVSPVPGDREGRLRTKLTDAGEGIYISGGKAEEIQWSKESPADPFVYALPDGEPLALAPGVTYINIVPLTAKIEIS